MALFGCTQTSRNSIWISTMVCTQTSRNSIWISTMVTLKQNIQIIRWTH